MAKNPKKLKASLNDAIDFSKKALIGIAFILGTAALSVKFGREVLREDVFNKLNPKQQKMILTIDKQKISKDSINRIYAVLGQYQSTIEKSKGVLIRVYEYTIKHENDTTISKKAMALQAGFGRGYSTVYGISLWDDLMNAKKDIKDTRFSIAGLNVAFYDKSVIDNLDSCEMKIDEFIKEYSKE